MTLPLSTLIIRKGQVMVLEKMCLEKLLSYCIRRHNKSTQKLTCKVLSQVWMVHETMAGKLHTLQSHWDMDVIKPWRETGQLMHESATKKNKNRKSKYSLGLPSQKALPERAVLGGQFGIFYTKQFSQQLYNS